MGQQIIIKLTCPPTLTMQVKLEHLQALYLLLHEHIEGHQEVKVHDAYKAPLSEVGVARRLCHGLCCYG